MERLSESLSRLHADDAAVMLLVEIWLDLINNKDLEAHKGITEKQGREAIECFYCFVSVAHLKCSLRAFEFQTGKEIEMQLSGM